MKKFLILLLIWALIMPFSIMADEYGDGGDSDSDTEETAPPEPAAVTPATNIKSSIDAQINSFLSAVGSNLTTAEKNTLETELKNLSTDLQNHFTVPSSSDATAEQRDARNELQAQKNTEAENLLSNKINTYFTQGAAKNSQIENLASNYATSTPALQSYYNQVGEFHEYFLQDMKNNPDQFAVSDYMSDYDKLRNTTEHHLETINADTSYSAGSSNFPAENFLDKGITPPDAPNIKFDLVNPLSLRNSMTIYSLLQNLRTRFSYDNTLVKEVNFFLDNYSSSENIVMDSSYPQPNLYSTVGQVANNAVFSVNEFGTFDNVTGDATAQGQMSNASLVGTSTLGNFNNRTYGYSNGAFPIVDFVIGNKKYRLQDTTFTSPIVFDMDGDDELEASNGKWLPHQYKNDSRLVEFDIDGDHFVDLTEWVGPNDGILLASKPGKNAHVKNMFGNYGGFVDGYEKLSLLDKNDDKVLTKEELKGMCVWQDKNLNAKIDSGEVKSLKELNITAINITHDEFVSSFIRGEEEFKMWDWHPTYFQVKKQK